MISRVALVALAVCVLAPGRAAANVGRRIWGGALIAEPGGIPDIAIQHEQLVLDLRPIAAQDRARVTATYQLDNHAAAATLSLVFVSGERSATDFTVTLDGATAQVSGVQRIHDALPAAWRAPATTPLSGGGEASYGVPDGSAFGFTLTVPSGAHTLAIAYQAEALHDHKATPTVLHQFAYVLAPARSWASFGGLDVTVQVPPGWDAAVAPAMSRTGDVFHAAFPALPGDAIALSLRAASPLYLPLRIVGLLALALVGLGGGFVVAAWSRRRARSDDLHPSLTRAACLGLAWSAVFLAVGMAAVLVPMWTIPAGEADGGYAVIAYAGLVMLGALALWPIGAVIAWWADRRIVLAARAAVLDA